MSRPEHIEKRLATAQNLVFRRSDVKLVTKGARRIPVPFHHLIKINNNRINQIVKV